MQLLINLILQLLKIQLQHLTDAGEILGRITSVLFNLNSAETNKDLQQLHRKYHHCLHVSQMILPLMKSFSTDRKIFDNRETSGLNTEQKILLKENIGTLCLEEQD